MKISKSIVPSDEKLLEKIREKANEFEKALMEIPSSRRRSVALTNLEQAAMWAVKAAVFGDD